MRQRLNIAVEIASAALALACGYPVLRYSSLEGVAVPGHFGFNGTVDSFGGRESLIAPFLVCIALYLIASLAQRKTSLINISDRAIDRDNEEVQEMLSDLALWLKLGLTALFASLSLRSYFIATGCLAADKPDYTQWIIIAFIFAMIILYWVRMRRAS